MTKQCTLKESFIENQLNKFQPGWRDGEDITAETKQKIKDYVSSKIPKELKEDMECITDYSIWHMAKKIRERENLQEPKKSNRGKKKAEKVCVSEPKQDDSKPVKDAVEAIRELVSTYSIQAIKDAIAIIENEVSSQ